MTTWSIRWMWTASIALWGLAPIARSQEPPTPAPEASAVAVVVDDETDATTQPSIAEAMARYAHEPNVASLIDAGLAHHRLSPRRVADLASRARTAGWVPTVRLSARRGQTIDLLAAQTTTTDRNSASTGDDLVLEAQLTFDLSKVVWSNNELRVEHEMRAERQERHKLTQLITTLYFERRKLQLQRDLNEPNLDGELRIAELEGLLDALTGGAFSRHRRRPASR